MANQHVETIEKDFTLAPHTRTHIVLMDGTWNDEDGKKGRGNITNVGSLKRLLVDDDARGQRVHYFRGVGNDEANGWLGMLRGGAFGRQEGKIRAAAFATLAKEWRPGDRICIFGFSRGAASARLLASDIGKKGIPARFEVTTEFRKNKEDGSPEPRVTKLEIDEKAGARKVDVDFLGVWDTVYAFGVPVNFLGIPFQKIDLFRDHTVSHCVKRAVHCVAIDETRDPYKPTLMAAAEHITEMWFAGVHSDVGGGYRGKGRSDDEVYLGDITQRFMIQEWQKRMREIGAPAPLEGALPSLPSSYVWHPHGTGYKKSLRRMYVKTENGAATTAPVLVHQSVMAMQNSGETTVVVEKRSGLFGKKLVREARPYRPENLAKANIHYARGEAMEAEG